MVIHKHFNNEIKSVGDNIFYKDISQKAYNLALKNSATHDMEIILTDLDGFNIVKCKNCNLYCKKLLNNNILLMNGKIIFITCDEYIIKEIIE